ncbi:MAG TPA: hypothetical protein ENO30_06955 [Thermodesulfobium narugense]|nr:hypothetical protein [Thermodesulfobium narugense]
MEENKKIKVSFVIERDLYRKFAKYGSYKWDVVSAILSCIDDIEIDMDNLYSMKPREARKWLFEEVRRQLNTKETSGQTVESSNSIEIQENNSMGDQIADKRVKKINSNDWW